MTVLEALTFETISTKFAAGVLTGLGVTGKAMIVLGEHNPTIYKSFRNIPGIVVRVAPAFSVRDVMDAPQIIIVKSALDVLDAQFGVSASSDKEATV